MILDLYDPLGVAVVVHAILEKRLVRIGRPAVEVAVRELPHLDVDSRARIAVMAKSRVIASGYMSSQSGSKSDESCTRRVVRKFAGAGKITGNSGNSRHWSRAVVATAAGGALRMCGDDRREAARDLAQAELAL
jgi:hypothetical protein